MTSEVVVCSCRWQQLCLTLTTQGTGISHSNYTPQIGTAQPAFLVVVIPAQLPAFLLKKFKHLKLHTWTMNGYKDSLFDIKITVIRWVISNFVSTVPYSRLNCLFIARPGNYEITFSLFPEFVKKTDAHIFIGDGLRGAAWHRTDVESPHPDPNKRVFV